MCLIVGENFLNNEFKCELLWIITFANLFLRTNNCTAVRFFASDTIFFLFCFQEHLPECLGVVLHLDCRERKVVIGTKAQLTTPLVLFVKRRKQMHAKGPIRIFTAGTSAVC